MEISKLIDYQKIGLIKPLLVAGFLTNLILFKGQNYFPNGKLK